MSKYYEKYEVPGGAFGIPTTVHIHRDGERRQSWQALMERARRRPSWAVRDAGVNIPERVSHEEIRRDARMRARGGREDTDDNERNVFFRNDSAGWRERPHPRDRHADALRQFRDALRQFYDQGGEDGPLGEFLAWIRAHMDPAEWQSPRPDPNRLNTEHTYQYSWPNPKSFARGYGLKTSGGGSNSSKTMESGSVGFRDSKKPQSLADLNQLHRRHYAAKGPL